MVKFTPKKAEENGVAHPKPGGIPLRVFYAKRFHVYAPDLSNGRPLRSQELYLDVSMNTTLDELSVQLRRLIPWTGIGTTFYFKEVFLDWETDEYKLRWLGTTCEGYASDDDSKTLGQAGFVVGNFLSVKVRQYRYLATGSAAAPQN